MGAAHGGLLRGSELKIAKDTVRRRSSQPPRRIYVALLHFPREICCIRSAHVIMSGIEAAGIVLAVFPIVVSGLQHFTEGLETIKNWRRYHRELSKYARTLETQRIVYLNTIERLLEGIIQSNDELEAFMSDPGLAFSRNPQYEERLAARLGRSYGNYSRIMADMLDALRAARKELGIDEDGKVRLVVLYPC